MRTLLAVQDISHTVGIIRKGEWFTAPEWFAEQTLKRGQAVIEGTRLVWPDLHWPASTVVCIASGPSLTKEDCALVQEWRGAADDRKVIVVNTSYKLAPWADVLYAADKEWWENYSARVKREFQGQCWTQVPVGDRNDAVAKFGLKCVRLERYPGLNPKTGFINGGGNSGYQAVGMAYQAGAIRIVLLGYDMGGNAEGQTHWHPEHKWWMPQILRDYANWRTQFNRLYEDLCKVSVEVVNASRATALTTIPRMPLEEALA